ncbi:MAG: FecR domain-containing protein [Lentisphaeraceae bacterium]|nr:FecR domain-containing protein [Lentisphaeraceae bacterium]
MNGEKHLQELIDKSLHDEISDTEKLELKKILDESPQAFATYLQAIEQQGELRDWAESYVEVKKPKKRIIHFALWTAAAALIAVAFIFMNPINSNGVELVVNSQSQGFKIIRQGKVLTKKTILQKGDQIIVSSEGQVKIDISGQQSEMYFLANTIVNITNKECNHLDLHQGEIRARLEKQKSRFIINTADGQAEIVGTEFAISDQGQTKLWVARGQVKMIKDSHHSIMVSTGQSIDTDSFQIKEKEARLLLPRMYPGVSYTYYRLKGKELSSMDKNQLIDRGITTDVTIFAGAYDGYVRARPEKHSFVANEVFAVVLKAYLKSAEGKQKLRLSSLRQASLRVNGRQCLPDVEGIVEVDFNEGFNVIEVRTIGGLEIDNGDILIKLERLGKEGDFNEIPSSELFYNSSSEAVHLNEQELQEAQTCHLPLAGKFEDKVTSLQAQPFGKTQFIDDERFGKVLKLERNFLRHGAVDKLGLQGPYTISSWIYMEEKKDVRQKTEQPFFSNNSGTFNGSLVLLIRRHHPYQAHLNNDSIAGMVLENKRWYHIVFRFHQNEQSIFVDGQQVMSSSGHSNLDSKDKLEIGRWRGSYFKGRMRDVRVYNQALSVKNIHELYLQTK